MTTALYKKEWIIIRALFLVFGVAVLSLSFPIATPAGAANTHAYCTLPADPAPGLPLMEACDPGGPFAIWYKERSDRGDANLKASGVVCTDDGKGCTDREGRIARYLQENRIQKVEWNIGSPQSCENHNSSRSNRDQIAQGATSTPCETDVGIKEEGVK